MGEYLAIGEHAPLVNRLRNGDSMSNYDERLRIEAADEIDRLRASIKPFAFLSEDNPKATVQDAWEMMYRDRFRDWVDFGDIEQARIALGKAS